MIPLTDEEIKFYEKKKNNVMCVKKVFLEVKRINLNT